MVGVCLLTVLVTFAACQTQPPATTKRCPKHEVFNDCASLCPEYCNGPLIKCQACGPGCTCEPGFVRQKPSGRCIDKDKCPPKTDPCSLVRCKKCEACKVDPKQHPHCVPSSDVCCIPPLTQVACLVNPCDTATCSYPNSTCIPYYCGGCHARFYDPYWRLLTKQQCGQRPN